MSMPKGTLKQPTRMQPTFNSHEELLYVFVAAATAKTPRTATAAPQPMQRARRAAAARLARICRSVGSVGGGGGAFAPKSGIARMRRLEFA
jgi:hypothetical protein